MEMLHEYAASNLFVDLLNYFKLQSEFWRFGQSESHIRSIDEPIGN